MHIQGFLSINIYNYENNYYGPIQGPAVFLEGF